MNPRPAGARIAAAILGLLILSAVFCDFLAPSPPETLDLQNFFAPPTRIHFLDANGRFQIRPFQYRQELSDPLEIRYSERVGRQFPLTFFCAGYEYRFLGLFPSRLHLVCPAEGLTFHPFGTDELGRDVLARLLAGARTSLIVVIVGLGLYALLGIAVGLVSGFSGGWIDSVLTRTSEFVLAIPALYLILALRALLPAKITYWGTVLLIAGTIALVAWPTMARGIRGQVMALRNAPYVEAARSFGSPGARIVLRHILPSLGPLAGAQAMIAAPVFLMGEAILSFLDIGFRGIGESWGSMLRNMKDPRIMTDFWWNLAPLFFIFVTILCLTILSRVRWERSPETGLFRT
jgi:peptide/nickel transport system permease protein